MVKNYTDAQLLNRAKSLKSFKGFPKGYFIFGLQSIEDVFNTFDDKFYLFKNNGPEFTKDINQIQFITVVTGTTNAGANALLKYDSYNREGFAVIKTDEWYYDVWQYGLHKGKMEALKQVKPFLISRDGDKDLKVEEGKSLPVICGINFHLNSYDLDNETIKTIIGPWSLGCQVPNNAKKYVEIIKLVKPQKIVTYCLMKEF